MKLIQYIYRDQHDPDTFHVGYKYYHDNPPYRGYSRTAFSIHIDDIDGMFGENVLLAAREMDKGDTRIIYIVGAVDDDE